MSTSSHKAFVPKPHAERSFDLHGLDGISDAQIAEHLALYAGYVKQVNLLNGDLATMVGDGQASGKNPQFAELTRRLGFEYNGMILHEHYFSNLSPAGAPTPPAGSAMAAALTEAFGSVEQWQAAFHAIGEMRGVGWAILFEDPATQGLTNHWVTLHHEGVPAGFRRTRHIHRGLLPEHRLADDRTPAPRSPRLTRTLAGDVGPSAECSPQTSTKLTFWAASHPTTLAQCSGSRRFHDLTA